MAGKAIRGLICIPRESVILFVRLYQITLSRFLGGHCRFHPSCSSYWIDALRKYGFIRGVAKGIWRICKCHPFHPGGVDPA